MNYKINFLILLFTVLSNILNAQTIGLLGGFSATNNNDFKNILGYGIFYEQNLKTNNKIDILFWYVKKNIIYDDNYCSMDVYGPDYCDYYFNKVNAQNKIMSFKFGYAFNILNDEHISFFIEPEIGLNYFMLKKNIHTIYYNKMTNNISEYNCNRNYNYNNRVFSGLSLEFDVKSFVFSKLDLFFRLNHEVSTYGKFELLMGARNTPWFISMVNVNTGLKYKISN